MNERQLRYGFSLEHLVVGSVVFGVLAALLFPKGAVTAASAMLGLTVVGSIRAITAVCLGRPASADSLRA